MDTIKELERRAERESEQHKARLRDNYSYARSLGFNPSLAKILSAWSKDRIDELHREKEGK
uniref:Uncharacterized protein n=1 Tax=viral metagenome TaxID=1070528 RepID=A0A6H2A3V6_9ZZZZ